MADAGGGGTDQQLADMTDQQRAKRDDFLAAREVLENLQLLPGEPGTGTRLGDMLEDEALQHARRTCTLEMSPQAAKPELFAEYASDELDYEEDEATTAPFQPIEQQQELDRIQHEVDDAEHAAALAQFLRAQRIEAARAGLPSAPARGEKHEQSMVEQEDEDEKFEAEQKRESMEQWCQRWAKAGPGKCDICGAKLTDMNVKALKIHAKGNKHQKALVSNPQGPGAVQPEDSAATSPPPAPEPEPETGTADDILAFCKTNRAAWMRWLQKNELAGKGPDPTRHDEATHRAFWAEQEPTWITAAAPKAIQHRSPEHQSLVLLDILSTKYQGKKWPTTKTELLAAAGNAYEKVADLKPVVTTLKASGCLTGKSKGSKKNPFTWDLATIGTMSGRTESQLQRLTTPAVSVAAGSAATANKATKSVREQGTVRRLNRERMIAEVVWTSPDGASRAFLHQNACRPGTWKMLHEGCGVRFKAVDQSGKPQPYRAVAVEFVEDGTSASLPPLKLATLTSERSQATLDELLDDEQDNASPHPDVTKAEARLDQLSDDIQQQISELFYGTQVEYRRKQPSVVTEDNRGMCAESGLFGSLLASAKHGNSRSSSVYLNVNEPFCLVATGVQGSGKSHTVSVVLENCLLPFSVPYSSPIVSLHRPMAALVLHYDQSETNVCEATGLVDLRKDLLKLLMSNGAGEPASHALSSIAVLVSPTFYKQRKRFYTSAGQQYRVLPLLFRWATLDAVQLKKLMRLNESDSQLYVGVMLAKLREYQRAGGVPEFTAFCDEIMAACSENKGQSAPLEQRLMVLRQFVAESPENQELQSEQEDLQALVAGGKLVVADMTDPMLAPAEANGVFQVLLEQFRQKKTDCGKVVVCDEAHKYFDGKSKGGDGLAGAIVDTVRLMRHEGIRVIVSTQSPLTMPPELLELASVAVCHSFHSIDWYKYMSNKLPLAADGFSLVQALKPGEALMFAAWAEFGSDMSGDVDVRRRKRGTAGVSSDEDDEDGATDSDSDGDTSVDHSDSCFLLRVRPRITADRGASRHNVNKV
eukprot:SAG22_NODE_124_length_18884_cov_34.149367_6_plen_1043_part_00